MLPALRHAAAVAGVLAPAAACSGFCRHLDTCRAAISKRKMSTAPDDVNCYVREVRGRGCAAGALHARCRRRRRCQRPRAEPGCCCSHRVARRWRCWSCTRTCRKRFSILTAASAWSCACVHACSRQLWLGSARCMLARSVHAAASCMLAAACAAARQQRSSPQASLLTLACVHVCACPRAGLAGADGQRRGGCVS